MPRISKFILTLIFTLVFASSTVNAQTLETHTIDGQSMQLEVAIDGPLDLLWMIDGIHYRYFVRTESGELTELINTRDENRKYQKQYLATLQRLTGDSTDELKKVDLTLYDLRKYVDSYNQNQDPNYISQAAESYLTTNLMFFGGITNHPLIGQEAESSTPQFGFEFEFMDVNNFPRHALYFMARHSFKDDTINYGSTELGLGYRYRFINASKFRLYAHITYATLRFISSETMVDDTIEDTGGTEFDTPFYFGVAADIGLGGNNFLTLGYNEIAAILVKSRELSQNIYLGYKFRL